MNDFVDIQSNPNYQVNWVGDVRRKAYSVIGKDGKTYRRKAMPIRKYLNQNGYYYVDFAKSNKAVHRLIAEHFIPNPDNKRTVNHKNGIKTDNRIGNLEWATDSEQRFHAYDTRLQVGAWTGKHSPPSKRVGKFSGATLVAEYPSARSASLAHGRCASAVWIAIDSKRPLAGFTWKYL